MYIVVRGGSVPGNPVSSGTIIHKIGVGGTGGIQSCETCHTQTALTYVNDATGNSSHTGVLMKPICISCHTGIDNELNNTAETHKAFYTAALG